VRREVKAGTDTVSLASGVVIAALGAFVLLDSSGALDLSLGWAAVVLSGAVGAMLVLSGLVNGGKSQDKL
jgi:hypothetical protein